MVDSPNPPTAAPRRKPASCCIVGAGPAGVCLAWLLAKQGVSVTLLERQADFDRDFRGDTLHPGVLEILDQLGLAERVLALPHTRMDTLSFHTAEGSLQVADLTRLRTKFPFVVMLPQAKFLEFMVDDARRFGSFRLVLGADVREVIWQDHLQQSGIVQGVRYLDAGQQSQEVRADLTVATDGRSSRLRREAGLQAKIAAPEIDVLWFRLPRLPGQVGGGYLSAGGYMIVLHRDDQWQIGYVIRKGLYSQLRAAGIEALRDSLGRLAPGLSQSLPHLTDWKQVRLLSVQSDRLRQWHRPGLLCLGDAAHVMSPVGGVGINYAIQDAVEAANLLSGPLLAGTISPHDLRAVERRRQWPTRVVQEMQAFDQRFLIDRALRTTGEYRLPLWLRILLKLPVVRNLPSRLFAFGVRKVSVRSDLCR